MDLTANFPLIGLCWIIFGFSASLTLTSFWTSQSELNSYQKQVQLLESRSTSFIFLIHHETRAQASTCFETALEPIAQLHPASERGLGIKKKQQFSNIPVFVPDPLN